MAAHLDPDILICDEVLAVGDVNFQQKCLNKMADVSRGGRTVLYVSHNMRTVKQLCTRGVYLEGGRLLYDGTVSHAIDLYAGSGLRSVDRDLDSMHRGHTLGVQLRMLRLRVENSETMEYQMDEAMEFSLTFRAAVPESCCRVRLVLVNNAASPVGHDADGGLPRGRWRRTDAARALPAGQHCPRRVQHTAVAGGQRPERAERLL